MSKKILFTALLSLIISACATSPLGRKQLILLPKSQVNEMGIQAYQQIKKKQTVSENIETTRYIRCISNALTAVVHGSHRIQWEVNVFSDDTANAFALPGGKIGVNTGLLNVAVEPDQLAAVIGHEIGHVLAHHGNERMSIEYATQTGTQLLHAIIGEPSAEKNQLMGLLGLGTQVGIALPFSRRHETEADIIGLDIMARAGFDPRASIQLWENMGKASAGAKPPEFLSTHPASTTRIKDLNKHMKKAMAAFDMARANNKSPQCR